jgi:periplasmic protein TonB
MLTREVPNVKTVGSGNVAGAAQQDRFIDAMFDMSPSETKRRPPLRLAVSALVHILVIAAALIIPIYFADNSIDFKAMTATYLVAPIPPAPPPPPAPAVQREVAQATRRTFTPTVLVAPREIPKTISTVAAAPPPLSVTEGVLGGVPGGTAGGVLGGTLGGSAVLPPPPPPAPARSEVVRVGGDVKPPRLLSEVQPVYPTIARVARVQGQVVVSAIIDPNGNVVSARAVSGPGLLMPAALEAVEKWKYAPTYLDGQAVSLAMDVTVTFNIGGSAGD